MQIGATIWWGFTTCSFVYKCVGGSKWRWIMMVLVCKPIISSATWGKIVCFWVNKIEKDLQQVLQKLSLLIRGLAWVLQYSVVLSFLRVLRLPQHDFRIECLQIDTGDGTGLREMTENELALKAIKATREKRRRKLDPTLLPNRKHTSLMQTIYILPFLVSCWSKALHRCQMQVLRSEMRTAALLLKGAARLFNLISSEACKSLRQLSATCSKHAVAWPAWSWAVLWTSCLCCHCSSDWDSLHDLFGLLTGCHSFAGPSKARKSMTFVKVYCCVCCFSWIRP